MQQSDVHPIVISFLHGTPGLTLVSLFKQAFPRHPASHLNVELAGAFLSTFAQHGTFLVARNRADGTEVGFAVGGNAAVLDRAREYFIRAHGWRIVGSFLDRRLSLRVLFSRLRSRRPMRRAAQAPYQIRFIVVDPRAQGMGVGTMLLEEFEGTLPAGSAYHAWTLEGPHGAEGFYLANGFRRDVALNGHLRMWKRP